MDWEEGQLGIFIMSYFSIQVNTKLNVAAQSVTKFIVYGVKHAFKKTYGAKYNIG